MSIMRLIFHKDFHESEFCKTCFPFIKRYFDYKDLSEIVETFVPTLSYDIRGIYFVPMRCSYSKIIYLLPRDNPMNQRSQSKNKNENKNETKNKNYQTIPLPHSANEVNDDKGIKVLRIMKTMKPDVYEVYSEDMDHLKKLGYINWMKYHNEDFSIIFIRME